MRTFNNKKLLFSMLIAVLLMLGLSARADIIIDNDIPQGTVSHWSVNVMTGGQSRIAFVTANRAASRDIFIENVLFDYFSYVDVGNNGGGFQLFGSAPAADSSDPDKVSSSGSFLGQNGNVINWIVRSSIADISSVMINQFILSTADGGPLGAIRFLQYMDEDIQGVSDDVFFTKGTLASRNLELFTMDNAEVYGVSHSGAFDTNAGLRNATFAGWAADFYNNMKPSFAGSGQVVTLDGIINNLSSFNHPQLGTVYGPRDIVSVLAWDVDPQASQAVIVTTLGGVPNLASTLSPPKNLKAVVGNGLVTLSWDSPEPVDGWRIDVARREQDGQFADIGTVNPSGLIQNPRFRVFGVPDLPLVNKTLYRFTVTAVKGDLRSQPSDPIFAIPGLLVAPPHPEAPILFLHGIHSSAATWDETKEYLNSTLGWSFGGELYHVGDSPYTYVRDNFLSSHADFYTATFGNEYADYAGHPGITHQGDEISGFLSALQPQGVFRKKIIFAHSMGGLAARDFLGRYGSDLFLVSQFITYGTPHLGGSFASLIDFATDATRDMAFDCVDGRLILSPFLNDLRLRPLPAELRYVSIIGHSASHRLGGCLSAHWDGLVPTDSANLSNSTTSPITIENITRDRLHTQETSDVSGILCALDRSCLLITVRSPVNVEITAPDNRKLSRDLVAIPGATYEEREDETGHTITSVLIPFALRGIYAVKVAPKPLALPNDTYSIEARQNGITTLLAQNEYIQNIPSDGYTVLAVPGNQPPIANAGQDRTVECASPFRTNVGLDGSASSDPDGDTLSFAWTGSFGTASGVRPMVTLPLGTNPVVLTVDDGRGGTSADEVAVKIVDTTSPTITSLTASPNVLWPPNHQMVPISVNANASDTCSAVTSCRIVGVSSNEPVNGLGDGDTAPDWQIPGNLAINLRAERSGKGSGRIYTITTECTDISGNRSTKNVTVNVPHDKSK